MTAAEQGRAPSDPHTAAMAAVGRAEVLDRRCIEGRRFLVSGIVQAMKHQGLHASAPEAVAAVERYYETEAGGDQIDGMSFTASLRRLRIQVVRDEERVLEAGAMTGRQAAEWAEDKATIRAWPCPTCEALPDVQCTNLRTGKAAGAWFPGHPARIVLATRAAG